MFDIFDTLIMPILVYGSDVWGSNKDSIDILDKVFLRFIRCTLGIKATTSNIIVAGECGRLPPSTQCILHTLCYVNRIIHMNGTSLVKQVYDELNNLREQGFNTWVTSLHNLADEYQIDLSLEPDDFHRIWKSSVRTKYIEQWSSCMMQFDRFPLLRTYRGIILEFKTEPYLYLVKNRRFRHAISQLRASSHTLQIERGRYTKPKTPVNERICIVCQCLEDELHFVTACSVNQYERDIFYNKVCQKFPEFSQLDDVEKFIFLFTFDDAQTLSWLGKCLYKSFEVRASLYIHCAADGGGVGAVATLGLPI